MRQRVIIEVRQVSDLMQGDLCVLDPRLIPADPSLIRTVAKDDAAVW
ncbi:MAG: hypothetical protein H0V71_03610 [Chloroflexi bacterium]|nr:hypothetical protein [Chloroflexota bacterium]